MLEETPDEFVGFQAHSSVPIAVSIVFPAKDNLGVGHVLQSLVGDGDPVGVPAQIFEYLLRTRERSFGVDHPVDILVAVYPFRESYLAGQVTKISEEVEVPGCESLP
jgi:hypothetical protein